MKPWESKRSYIFLGHRSSQVELIWPSEMRRDIARLEDRAAVQEDLRESYWKEKVQEESDDESVVDMEKESVP